MKSICFRVALIALWHFLLCVQAAQNEVRLPPEIEMNESAGHWGRVFVKLRVGDLEDVLFLLDTGASITTVDKSLQSKLGKRLERTFVSGWRGKEQLAIHASPQFFLAGTQLPIAKVGVMDLKLPQNPNFERGILGMDCLANYCIQFDFEARKLRFLESQRLVRTNLGKEFQIKFRKNLPYIYDSTLTGLKSTELLVDSGYDLDGRVETPSDEAEHPEAIRLSDCQWNGWNYTNVAVRHGDGLKVLGLRFLARHLVTLDFPEGKMYLKQTRTAPLAAADVEAAGGFLKSLKKAGQLSDWLPEEKGFLAATPNDLETLVGWRAVDSKLFYYNIKYDLESGAFRLEETRSRRIEGN